MSFRLKYKDTIVYTSENISGDGLPELLRGYYNSNPVPNGVLEFADTGLSSDSQASIAITNTGNASMDIVGVNLNPLIDEIYSLSSTVTVGIGETKFIGFQFSPIYEGIHSTNATIVVENASNGSFFTYLLTGTGMIAEFGLEYPNGYMIDFGDIFKTDTESFSFYIENSGLGVMTFSNIYISGANASEFSISGGIPSLPFDLSSSEQNIFTIIADPINGSYGNKFATIYFETNIGTIQYPLTARGTQYDYLSTPGNSTTLPFGDIDIGIPETQIISIYNDGNLNLQLSAITVNTNKNAWVSVPSTPINIAGQATYPLNVTITPDETAYEVGYILSGDITIQTNDGNFIYYINSNIEGGTFISDLSGSIIKTSDGESWIIQTKVCLEGDNEEVLTTESNEWIQI